MSQRFKQILDDGTVTGGDDTSELNGSAFLSESTDKEALSKYKNGSTSREDGKSHHSTSISLKIGMVALKHHKAAKAVESTAFGESLGSPNHGHELEHLIDMLKQL